MASRTALDGSRRGRRIVGRSGESPSPGGQPLVVQHFVLQVVRVGEDVRHEEPVHSRFAPQLHDVGKLRDVPAHRDEARPD
jgi:hypothetical protein